MLLKIKNTGLIEQEALHLVGASTKRGDSSKIGQFGSGNKYALALLIREGYSPKIFSGTTEIVVETKPVQFRDETFNVVFINGEKTSITDSMGKDWEFWQAIREIYCNALDEGGSGIEIVDEISLNPEETHFYIKYERDAEKFMQNFSLYFSTNTDPLFKSSHGEILPKKSDKANIYRKGVRCVPNSFSKKSFFDYNFNEIAIGENRLYRNYWDVSARIWDNIMSCTDESIINTVLKGCNDSEYAEGDVSNFSSIEPSFSSSVFRDYVSKNMFCPNSYIMLLDDDEVKLYIYLPDKIFYSLKSIIKDNCPHGLRTEAGKKADLYRIIERPTQLQEATLVKAKEFLSECYPEMVDAKIEIVKFSKSSTLGMAVQDEILISEKSLDLGVGDTINTLIHEYIHIKYGVPDESRAFQDAVITELVRYMKTSNAFVI